MNSAILGIGNVQVSRKHAGWGHGQEAAAVRRACNRSGRAKTSRISHRKCQDLPGICGGVQELASAADGILHRGRASASGEANQDYRDKEKSKRSTTGGNAHGALTPNQRWDSKTIYNPVRSHRAELGYHLCSIS